MTGVFVGRQSEIEVLRLALTDTVAGRGRLVMLGGEPGIGKTRICQEMSAYSAAMGIQALYGRCLEEIGPAPYWPWVQILRTYVRDCLASNLGAEMERQAAILAELVPEVREKFPGIRMPQAQNIPEQGRLRLFDAVTTFLQHASQSQPLLLIFDNLHWADKSSLLLLEFMAEELANSRLLIMGTYRDTELSCGHPLQQALGELTKLPHFQRLSLAGLTEHDVADYITRVCEVAAPSALLREIHSRTAGNPLFVTEVVRRHH